MSTLIKPAKHYRMTSGFTDSAHAETYESNAAGGALILAKDTKRILIGQRGLLGDYPLFWATLGGNFEKGEGPRTAVRREIKEETGYEGPMRLVPLMIYGDSSRNFKYYNFLGIVPWEFEPKICDENNKLQWCNFDDYPEPRHPGFQTLLDSNISMTRVRRHVFDLPLHRRLS